jgi:hypothetical protein
MTLPRELQILADAQGDPALLALATVDLTFLDLTAEERAGTRAALAAAAVPHWCDAAVLRDLSPALPGATWERLQKLPVVEPFPARGPGAANVHETNRLALRKWLADTDPDELVALSARGRDVQPRRAPHQPGRAGLPPARRGPRTGRGRAGRSRAVHRRGGDR